MAIKLDNYPYQKPLIYFHLLPTNYYMIFAAKHAKTIVHTTGFTPRNSHRE